MGDQFRVLRFRAHERPDFMALSWRLRYQVFHEDLGWRVPIRNALELDEFDRQAVHCAVLCDDIVVGSWRALPTDQPYLLETTFPGLLVPPLPKSSTVWEISRFAVMPNSSFRREVGRLLVREAVAFGRDREATRLIAVTDPFFERFVRSCGLLIQRIGGPRIVGSGKRGPVSAVVITCELDPATLASVGLEPLIGYEQEPGKAA